MLHAKFKHMKQVVQKKKISEYFPSISTVQTQDPLVQGHFGPLDLHLNKLGEGQLGNTTYKSLNI